MLFRRDLYFQLVACPDLNSILLSSNKTKQHNDFEHVALKDTFAAIIAI